MIALIFLTISILLWGALVFITHMKYDGWDMAALTVFMFAAGLFGSLGIDILMEKLLL